MSGAIRYLLYLVLTPTLTLLIIFIDDYHLRTASIRYMAGWLICSRDMALEIARCYFCAAQSSSQSNSALISCLQLTLCIFFRYWF